MQITFCGFCCSLLYIELYFISQVLCGDKSVNPLLIFLKTQFWSQGIFHKNQYLGQVLNGPPEQRSRHYPKAPETQTTQDF